MFDFISKNLFVLTPSSSFSEFKKGWLVLGSFFFYLGFCESQLRRGIINIYYTN